MKLEPVPTEALAPGVLFHPDHVAVLELDAQAAEAYDRLNDGGEVGDPEIEAELIAADLARDPRRPRRTRQAPDVETMPVRALVLNITHGCNLSCRYCYADTGSARTMDMATARAAVDFLLKESRELRQVSLSFLGGEPLLHFPLVQGVVDYAEGTARDAGKAISFSLTTNGTLLSPVLTDYLDRHRVGITISMDGPADVHDAQRPMRGGGGSFARLQPRVREFLATPRPRPVGARVTLTRESGPVLDLYRFLRGLGFQEVGFSPVTASHEDLHLGDDDMARLLDDFGMLADHYVVEACAGAHPGFSNLSNLLAEIHRGEARTHACGAGLGLMAADPEGQLYLCHRFTSQAAFHLGDVRAGIDPERRGRLAAQLQRPQCSECWMRHLCAGGCYHEALVRQGDAAAQNRHVCAWMRQWTRLGLKVYLQLTRRAPGFLDRLAGSRRPEPGVGGYR